jgi:hypothetical protein
VLLLLPFVPGAYLVLFRLRPVEMPDSATYLWRAPITLAFFTSRGLTQRALYALVGNQPRAAALVQLACAALVVGAMHGLLRDRGKRLANVVLAAIVALFATSFDFLLGNVVLDADCIALYTGLGFPFVLVLSRGRARPFLVAATGIVAVFARNTAPAILFVEMAVFAVAVASAERVRREGPALGVVATVALASALIARQDTSLGINAANDVFQRVLPDAALVEHFHTTHGLPDSESIAALRGKTVVDRLDGRALFRTNWRTRSPVLVPGEDAFLLWVASRGFREYWTHLLVHTPFTTVATFATALAELQSRVTVQIRADYAESRANDAAAAKHNARVLLGDAYHDAPDFDEGFYLVHNLDVAAAVRRGALPSGRFHYDHFGRAEGRLANAGDAAQRRIPPGLLGFDPLAEVTAFFAALRLSRLPALLVLLAVALVVARRAPEAPCFLLAAVLLAGGLAGFFLGYFGDAMDVERHVSVPVLTLTIAQCVLLGAALLWRQQRRPGRSAT